ncbi:MAG: DNA primase, partial [Gammaproteobacteria bacterium]|nr:DNA primase [Gammaproteobacteria bacterium]
YQAELQQLADNPNSQMKPTAADIAVVLKQMSARKLSAELRTLTSKFERGEKLSDEEKARKRELHQQLHSINKKRARIYARH